MSYTTSWDTIGAAYRSGSLITVLSRQVRLVEGSLFSACCVGERQVAVNVANSHDLYSVWVGVFRLEFVTGTAPTTDASRITSAWREALLGGRGAKA